MAVVSDQDFISFLPFPVELLPFVLDVDARTRKTKLTFVKKINFCATLTYLL